MWLNWLPWRYIVRRVARAQGFIDPITVLSHLHRFAQPSEVAAPLELLRAGVVFHARGLMNTGAIQHNLDWVWPYWVERQFDPHDESFIPRAFSITHVNLTHRNWTAVGQPGFDWLPIVDPRGMLTPLWDGWSLDAWVVTDDGRELIPSQQIEAQQRWELGGEAGVAVVTETEREGLKLRARSEVLPCGETAVCHQHWVADADTRGWLVVALRPYNAEGVKFIHDVALDTTGRTWTIDGVTAVHFGVPVERHQLSTYRMGDVRTRLRHEPDLRTVTCDVGMATAAALFQLEPNRPRHIQLQVPMSSEEPDTELASRPIRMSWEAALAGHCRLRVPDDRFQFLYDAALRTLVLHSPEDVFPGPYTYKRFWFRDAALILHGMLAAGMTHRVERALDRFPMRQMRDGYFRSQEGEWDANGEALWIMHRYCELTGREPPEAWRDSILRGAEWIMKKRLPDDGQSPHSGLLPSGFSAEHLGPNDYYYWDDFWGVAGLRSAAAMAVTWGDDRHAERFRSAAQQFSQAIDRSIESLRDQRTYPGVPASPYRRMDTGAIGSLACGYPLQLWEAQDPRLLDTANFLVKQCFFQGGFFQDMIHSGINAYLTLHVAQVLLRAGDMRALDAIRTVADLASPTGQWPEAIHPRTRGGCMGDGQHVWAAAEWVLMMRHCFVREEANTLVLCSGIPAHWLAPGERLSLGPTPTPFGDVTVEVEPQDDEIVVHWHGRWRGDWPAIEVRFPGRAPAKAAAGDASLVIRRTAGGASPHHNQAIETTL